MIDAIISTLFSIGLLLARYRNKRRFNDVHRNSRSENTRPRTAVPTIRRVRAESITLAPPRTSIPLTAPEEDVLQTPPPQYAPSTTTPEEDIPLTPPPPYTRSTIHMEREEENIPLTPPPPYVQAAPGISFGVGSAYLTHF
jgi:hypothetical protein